MTSPRLATDGITPRPRWYVLLALWSVPGLLNAMTWITLSRLSGRPLARGRLLVADLPVWLLGAALTPMISSLGPRFPVNHGLRGSVIAVHGAAIVFASRAHGAVATAGVIAAGIVRPPLTLAFT